MNRPICANKGCDRRVDKNGHGTGWRKLCWTCARVRNGKPPQGKRREARFPNKECSLCSWKGPCDRHRIKRVSSGTGYVRGNVLILCPNCHRLLHQGLLQVT